MNRKCFVKVFALSLIFVAVAGLGLAQEKPRKPQDAPRTSMIDELWRQAGHRETPQKTTGRQQRRLEPQGATNEAQIAQLWQQIGSCTSRPLYWNLRNRDPASGTKCLRSRLLT